jgi:N-dimethylarginine dimethylaminohydrolase
LTALALSEVGRITSLVVKHARDAFVSQTAIDAEWRALGFTAPPQFTRAVREYDQFLDLLAGSGAAIHSLPRGFNVGLDSIYVRDASVVTPAGVMLCHMGKPARAGEPAAQDRALLDWGVPVAGAIRPPGRLEGGDVVWLGERRVAVGRGYRTNAEGIAAFRRFLGDAVDEMIVVPLPHWRGPGDVFHLMSVLSPIDRDLVLVYAPLLPVPFLERLVDLGYGFVEVPDEEFESMGANVLALQPRQCIALAGNPLTRRRLEAAGAEVLVYKGIEISLKGGGGPTCLTRPLGRLAV